ncbi:SURF1 family protein [Neoehrlichia mikurensis]|uniref:SURF1-like protein n=1 Tax=Neoehrlichia mikurensis TaxID=89586 RepID=A0A9Q9F3X8_9RICK|nr:SURF1 family protein [Neoehrlichia mikurensis]UTO55744.1 SURF1 family protein [Neoehrlichia mikurensis]UTO56661.1 SURF1 family protein [Neoehrlichia mikurensis]
MKNSINYCALIVLPFCIMCILGTWQVFRLREKLRIIDNMKSLPIVLPNNDIKKYAYKNVSIRGSFENQNHFNVFAGSVGYYFLQPFKLVDGRTILVNRGILTDYKQQINILNNNIININGMLYCNFDKKIRWFIKNDSVKNLWIWFDIDGMSKVINVKLEACIIWADKTGLLGNLKPNMTLQVRNDHLEYIITWYSLAIIWVAGCIGFILKNNRK